MTVPALPNTWLLCKAALGTVLFHDIMQGMLGKAGGLSEFP